MSDNIWSKVAAGVLIAGILGLMGWALLEVADVRRWVLTEVYDVRQVVTRIEDKLTIWTSPFPTPRGATPTSGASSDYGDGYEIVLAGGAYQGDQALAFAQKSMGVAAQQLLRKDHGGALETLLLGLKETGVNCVQDGDRLSCK